MPKTVLLVDDSSAFRRSASMALKAAGFQVAEAFDGQDALDQARMASFDVVVTDQVMPRLDGLMLTRMLRTLPTYLRVPILVLTTEPGSAVTTRLTAAGASGFLAKPVEPLRLVEIVRKIAG